MAQFVFQGSETVSPSFYKKTQVLGGGEGAELLKGGFIDSQEVGFASQSYSGQ